MVRPIGMFGPQLKLGQDPTNHNNPMSPGIIPRHGTNTNMPTVTSTVKNPDGSVTEFLSNGNYRISRSFENGDSSSQLYTFDNKLRYVTDKKGDTYYGTGYDEQGRVISKSTQKIIDNRLHSTDFTFYEYYGDSNVLRQEKVDNMEINETTVTSFAEDGKTPIEKYITKGGVTTYYDPNDPNKILKQVTDKGTVQETRVPDKNGNLVLQE